MRHLLQLIVCVLLLVGLAAGCGDDPNDLSQAELCEHNETNDDWGHSCNKAQDCNVIYCKCGDRDLVMETTMCNNGSCQGESACVSACYNQGGYVCDGGS